MNLYKSLLFLHGHVVDPALARSLAEGDDAPQAPASGIARRPFALAPRDTPGVFRSLWYLGGLHDLDLQIGEHGEPYAPRDGNRRASARRFGGAVAPAAGSCLAGC